MCLELDQLVIWRHGHAVPLKHNTCDIGDTASAAGAGIESGGAAGGSGTRRMEGSTFVLEMVLKQHLRRYRHRPACHRGRRRCTRRCSNDQISTFGDVQRERAFHMATQ